MVVLIAFLLQVADSEDRGIFKDLKQAATEEWLKKKYKFTSNCDRREDNFRCLFHPLLTRWQR
jgi:hypothetical protein